jgi:hypothetical protein
MSLIRRYSCHSYNLIAREFWYYWRRNQFSRMLASKAFNKILKINKWEKDLARWEWWRILNSQDFIEKLAINKA